MKRVNKEWWKGVDGYYYEKAKHTYEGPFAEMQQEPAKPPVDSGEIIVEPVKKVVDNDDEV